MKGEMQLALVGLRFLLLIIHHVKLDVLLDFFVVLDDDENGDLVKTILSLSFRVFKFSKKNPFSLFKKTFLSTFNPLQLNLVAFELS